MSIAHASTDGIRLMGSTIFSHGFLRIAFLSTASLAAGVPAKAAVFWSDDDIMRPPAIMVPEPQPVAPPPQRHHQNRLKQHGARLEKQAKEQAKPVGPLVIAISINNQTMRVFDANGLFAETRVSTGMRGHETPMGVFSVIQKNKWHKSNIYSSAPMPYMQRITWSGIALHAGVLPGYAASHGCIRMPMAFATKLWGWTRMGARVIITPDEISPVDFSHPRLLAQKPAPIATIPAPLPRLDQSAVTKPVDAASTDLGLKPTTDSGRGKTVTADATGALAKPVLSDAPKVEMPTAAIDPGKPADKTSDDTAHAARPSAEDAETKTAETPATGLQLQPPSPAPKADAQAGDKTGTKPDAARIDSADVPPPPNTSPKRTGPVAVLISGKDSKLYVRQDFSPLFETPITIKPSERPLGTHIFTARIDKDPARSIHWTATSLPAVAHRAAADVAGQHHRKPATVEAPVHANTDSPAEALDRISIPEGAMTQIAEAIGTGGSIIVSDQSIKAGGETGQGTEFIVPMR